MNRLAAWFVGGLLTASGLVTAAFGGFCAPEGPTAVNFPVMGYDGIDNIQVFSQGMVGVALFLSGVALMAWASSGAWKETGGY